jgi:hypothetical protein
LIKAYGVGFSGDIVSSDDFLSRVYINDQLFYLLIDVAVLEIRQGRPVVFARVSGHPPGPLGSCWNGIGGPFKQLEALEISER